MKQLSKSDYMLFLKHPAWLWFKKHDQDKLPPVDDDLQAIFDAGFLFESYAEKLFPEAVKLECDRGNYNSYKELPNRTEEAIKSGAKTILQGRFESDRITCVCDVLSKNMKGGFDLYEIKSSTQAKPEHVYDLAFQTEVLERCGYKIDNISVVHVNNQYIKNGEIKPEEIAKITEISDEVKSKKEETKKGIDEALSVIDNPTCPDISPSLANMGAFSEWLEIYKTLANIEEYSIYHLCSPGSAKIGELEKMGIKKLSEIPSDFKLNNKQRSQVEATKFDEVFINKPRIKTFLESLEYPLYFLDYETLSSVIPYFDGLGPYKQLPFQYSLHVIEKPGDEPKHFEYLHTSNTNPVVSLSETLKSQIGESGTVLVWFEGFEKSCNNLMGLMAPEYSSFYENLNDRIVDLMTPFSTCSYVHKDFFGSASIKKVLPVLIPELSYKDLDIQAGGAAQRLWMEAVLDGKRKDEKDKILSDLKKYCELDTYAMVRIYEHLLQI